MRETPAPVQTFNHVAMSVPAALLDAQGRASLLDFFGEVFGWTEMPGLSVDGKRLVMRAHSNEQFVFLEAGAEPMRCPSGDHFGLSVRTVAELDAILERARNTASAIRACRSTRRRSRTTACSSFTASTSATGCRSRSRCSAMRGPKEWGRRACRGSRLRHSRCEARASRSRSRRRPRRPSARALAARDRGGSRRRDRGELQDVAPAARRLPDRARAARPLRGDRGAAHGGRRAERHDVRGRRAAAPRASPARASA